MHLRKISASPRVVDAYTRKLAGSRRALLADSKAIMLTRISMGCESLWCSLCFLDNLHLIHLLQRF